LAIEYRKPDVIPVTGTSFLADKRLDTMKMAIFNVDDIIDITAASAAI
jgi:hypothetical protein